MKKIYLWGWNDVDGKQVVIGLQQQQNIEIINPQMSLQDGFLDTVIHKHRLLPFISSQLTKSQKTFFNAAKPIFFDMYSRVRSSKGISYHELEHIFWKYVNHFFNEMVVNRPDVVLFSSPPHYGAEYLLYLSAKLLNIDVKIGFQSLFENRFFVVDSLEQLGKLDSLPVLEDVKIDIRQFKNQQQFYMKGIKFKKESCWLKFWKHFLIKPFSKKPLKRSAAFAMLNDCKSYRYWSEANSQLDIDFDQKYVYLPLQLQPEVTTSGQGGALYADQLNMVDALVNIIPSDWKIYVKENPKQDSQQRGENFFNRLFSNPQVVYVHPSISSFKLIEYSQLVSMVTGTAGWEALLYQKPVISFGFAWFNDLPGVFRYQDGLTLEEVLSFSHSNESLQFAFNQLMSKAYDGVIDQEYRVIVNGFDHKKNQQKVLKAINQVLFG